jgi:hypothetical protein
MKRSPSRKAEFVRALVKGATPEGAARRIGVTRETAYQWRRADPAFAKAWATATDRKVELVESILFRMAKRWDLGAVIFFLKSYRPEVFNRRQQISVGGDPELPPIGLDVSQNLVIYLPANFRDKAERNDEVPEDAQPTIEGQTPTNDGEDEAAA